MSNVVGTGGRAIERSPSAVFKDLGSGVAGLEITTEFGICDASLVEHLGRVPDAVAAGFQALVISGGSPRLFSAGASLDPFIASLNTGDYSIVEAFLADGQHALQRLKYAPFPVVAAVHVAALSGGCELVLHADALVVEPRTVFGFRERWSGIVPGWGGGIQVMLRLQETMGAEAAFGRMFEAFARATLHAAPDAAIDAGFLRGTDRIGAGRETLVAEAVALAAELAVDYRSPEPATLALPDARVRAAAEAVVAQVDEAENLTAVERTACEAMIELCVTTPGPIPEADQMRREREVFVELLRNGSGIGQRMEAILASGGRRPVA